MALSLRIALTIVALCATIFHAHAAQRPPIEDLLGDRAFTGAALSPSGKYLAVRFAANGSRQRLAMIDLETRAAQQVAQFDDTDIADFEWVTDQRLVFDTDDGHIGVGDRQFGAGLWAVDRDGKDFVQLIAVTYRSSGKDKFGGREIQPWNTRLLFVNPKKDSETVYVHASATATRSMTTRSSGSTPATAMPRASTGRHATDGGCSTMTASRAWSANCRKTSRCCTTAILTRAMNGAS